MREIPSYIIDTNNFISKINSFPVLPNSLLVSMDVKSLYTSIANNEGIASVKKKYDHYPKKTIPIKIITTLLVLILTLNNFIFNSKFYLQIKAVLWEPSTPLHMRVSSCQNLKKNISTL